MSSSEWIEIIGRAIDMSADWEVHDEESNLTFQYDLEALHGIQTSLEAGATSEEIEHQFDDFVQGNFERFVDVLQQALEGAGEDVEGGDGENEFYNEKGEELDEVPVLDERPQSAISDETLDADPDKEESLSNDNSKSSNKKGVVIAAAVSGLLVVLGGGGFVAYELLNQGSTAPPQARNVQTINKANPATAPEASEIQREASQQAPSPVQSSDSTYSVTQMDDPANAALNQQEPSARTVIQPSSQQQAQPLLEVARKNTAEFEEVKAEVSSQIAEMENSVKSEMGSRFDSLRDSLENLEQKLSKLDELERKVSEQESSKETQSALVESQTKGLTRIGDFSILAQAGLANRVVALSPTNRVITLEEGEGNVLAAGENLTVREIIGEGSAVIFSNGWFIDGVRAPETQREQRNTAEAQADAQDDKAKSAPAVPNTAKVAASPSPARIASAIERQPTSNIEQMPASSQERFPSIRRAPEGWEATALIPPRRAVIITPDGDSITITSGSQLTGLGTVHTVKYDRVLAGQFYIPLSNM
jgi:hypothetical protein